MQVAERRLKVSLKQIGGTPNPLNLHICRFDGDIYKFTDESMESKVAGLPAGTKIAMVRITPYEMLITFDRGQPRMLAVYPDFDGD
jgi:hypothetical protein